MYVFFKRTLIYVLKVVNKSNKYNIIYTKILVYMIYPMIYLMVDYN